MAHMLTPDKQWVDWCPALALTVTVILLLPVPTIVCQSPQPSGLWPTTTCMASGTGACDGGGGGDGSGSGGDSSGSGGDVWSCAELDYCDDVLGFEAISWLHRQLDDDGDGDVDVVESNEFLRDELKYENGYETRQKAFHGNDKHITVDELWRAWKSSTVRNWTVDDTREWLCDVVELPQYVDTFANNAVDGLALPRLAANTQFMAILGINNPIHKQKLALKAMDVVLFGAPKHHNYLKDVLLICSLLIAIVGVWFAYVQHKYSQSHLKKMMADMDSLQRAEEQLMGLQTELDLTRQQQQMVVKEKVNLEKKLKENESQIERSASYTALSEVWRISELEDQLKRVNEELRRAQNAGVSSSRWAPPVSLQQWLQLTHELEIRSFNAKRCAAELQLYAAKEGCDKLRKKRASLLGAFRVAHGNSIDDVDNRILEAKTALSEVTKDLQERVKRWQHIEMYCGFSIVHNPGIAYLEQALYGSPVTTPVPIGLSHAGSETTIVDDDSLHLRGYSMVSLNDEDMIGEDEETDNECNPSDSSMKEDLKQQLSVSVSMGRPKMVKSYSEDQDSSHRSQCGGELPLICHSESCSELQTLQTLPPLTSVSNGSSDYHLINNNNNTNEKTSETMDAKGANGANKGLAQQTNTCGDREDREDRRVEKKRTFFGLRKRKNSRH